MICPYCKQEIPSKDFALKTPEGNYWHFPCSDMALDEWKILRDSIQRLSAQVVAYQEVLQKIKVTIEEYHPNNTLESPRFNFAREIYSIVYTAIHQPDPGAEIRERMVKPEITNSTTSRDIECTESYDLLYRAFDITKNENETLRQALAALGDRP